jgi:hypothetical protein
VLEQGARPTTFSRLATPIRSQKSRIAGGCVPSAAHAHDGGHTRIVPSVDVTLLHQLQQLAFARHRVGQFRRANSICCGCDGTGRCSNQPVVKRTMIFELERAERMRDVLDCVRRGMREVVHRVDAPVVTGAVMVRAANAIEHRVAHVDVRRRHVDARAQYVSAVLELARAHPRQQIEVLLNGAVPVRTVHARLRSAFRAGGVFRPHSDCRRRRARCESGVRRSRRASRNNPRRSAARPAHANPSHRTSDSIDSTYSTSSFAGVRVVVAKVARTGELGGNAEIQADRLRVADMQIPVRLRRKPCRHTGAMPAGFQVIRNDGADEIEWSRRVAFKRVRGAFSSPFETAIIKVLLGSHGVLQGSVRQGSTRFGSAGFCGTS